MNTQASGHCSGADKLADTKLDMALLCVSVRAADGYYVRTTGIIALLYLWLSAVRYFCPTKCIDLVAICCRYASNGATGYRNKLTDPTFMC
jgi:hypothetical protein